METQITMSISDFRIKLHVHFTVCSSPSCARHYNIMLLFIKQQHQIHLRHTHSKVKPRNVICLDEHSCEHMLFVHPCVIYHILFN